ncbi:MAG: aldehyde ferredoxin oxidoreductase, partial [Chloroflexi bacterium]|nr:aldehyde ferredoxin oxidoreductase [Chloroflexota bacterium]
MKLLRVNMNSRAITVEDVPQDYVGLGGRGLTSIMVNAEVPPKCDPLGPENKLIFAPGYLTGTPLPNTSRISIGGKSPLTGTIKESNVGGTVATALADLGITAIIVEGQAPAGELSLLGIDQKGEASLVPAQEYRGMRTYALVERMLKAYGEKTSVLCIGPAGEQRLAVASIQSSDVDGRPCRAAGRGGMGAVMGAKGLKALVVDQRGKSADAIADAQAFKKRGGKTTHMGCSQCAIHCSNEFVDAEGKYVTSSLEYETIWAMGGMTGVVDLDTIARLDHLCDDLGVDTMSTGVGVAVAMDAGYRQFGDAKAVVEMVEEIGRGTDFGKILGSGPAAVGKHFNNKRVPVVKGQ